MTQPKWSNIVVHHTVSPDTVAPNADSIRRYHMEDRGYADVGYHALVELDGDKYIIVKGRPEHMQGAHTYGRNHTDLGVALIGDFTVFPPPLEQLVVAARQCAKWCREYSISPMTIRPHRVWGAKGGPTECPGRAFSDAYIHVLREEVKRILKQEAVN